MIFHKTSRKTWVFLLPDKKSWNHPPNIKNSPKYADHPPNAGHGFAALVKAFHWVSKSIKVIRSETGANRMITKTL